VKQLTLDQLDGCWIAVKVRAKYELSIGELLVYKGYEIAIPRKARCTRCHDCDGTPLFPGYIILRYDTRNPWHIVKTPGVAHIVSFGELIPQLSEEEVKNLAIVTASDRCKSILSHAVSGQSVVITKGPLAGTRGIFSRTSSAGRIIISIPLFNRSVSVDLEAYETMSIVE
jgi:transcription termination/antitermination protein NusG